MFRFLTRRAPLCVAVLAAPVFAGTPDFTYNELPTLGGSESTGWGLNDHRQVVGWSTISDDPVCGGDNHPCRHAYLWEAGVMIDLGVLAGDDESHARAINNAGLVVGTSEHDVIAGFGQFSAFSWTAGPLDPLPDLGQQGTVLAHDVNENGVIAGHATDPNSMQDRAVTWTGGVLDNLGVTEAHTYNRFEGINDFNVGVGFGWNLFQPNDAILFDGLGWFTIGGEDGPFQNAEAKDANNTGLAVGLMAFPSGPWRATIWSMVGPPVDAGTLPGMDYSEFYDINDAGHAVGRAYSSDGLTSRAIYWDGSTLHDLNDLVPGGVSGPDGVLYEAREINENGDIVGSTLKTNGFRAFLLTIDDGGCDGDVDGSGTVNFQDVLEALTNWGPCGGCDADLDGSGVVDFADVLLILTNWGPCA